MSSSVVKRSQLLASGFALAAVVAIGTALNGISWISVDELIDHPLASALFMEIPAAGALLSLLLVALRRTLQINVLVLLGLWLAAEFAFGAINWYQAPTETDDRDAVNADVYIVPDRALGYRPVPNAVARHTASHNGHQEFSVTYRFDSFGRRETPVDPGTHRSGFLLFFGDSNTFGEGLEERQTLPYCAGALAPDYRPYNYGFSGWGPAQMLELVKNGDLSSGIDQQGGFAIFFFIKDHLARVTGSSLVSPHWGRDFPYYTLDPDGRLVHQGNFAHDRQFTTLFYYFVASSQIAQYFDFVFPRGYSDGDYRLTAEIMAESQRYLERQFKLRGFYVVISPTFDKAQLQISRKFMSDLQKAGVKYLDYTQLYDTSDVKYRISEWNYHNSALANQMIAHHLVTDLGIGAAAGN